MTFLFCYDPGKITGFSQGYFDDDRPYELMDCRVFDFESLSETFHNSDMADGIDDVRVIEKFRLNMGNEFLADLEGVQVEGMLRHQWPAYAGYKIHWQYRDEKGKAGVMDAILKKHGLWQEGGDVNWTDGRDVNDTIIHSLVWLRNHHHRPTLEKYFRA